MQPPALRRCHAREAFPASSLSFRSDDIQCLSSTRFRLVLHFRGTPFSLTQHRTARSLDGFIFQLKATTTYGDRFTLGF